jgi:two-component system cell cycle sensor histidine kinase/response regulator CckA
LSLVTPLAPVRLIGAPAYALAIVVTGVAGLVTRTTWPLFTPAPFALLFFAVYVSVRWGTRGSGIAATATGYVWALWLSPPDVVQFNLIPSSIFATIAVLATHLISSRTEALEARQASEARAIRALEETTAAEAKLRQAQKMEAVGQLVAGVAHNFNNLLTITMGYADLLTDHVSAEGRGHLEEIRHATDRGAKLTRQLLGITRKRDLGLTHVDVNTAVRELESLLIPLIREDIALVIQPSASPVVTLIDPQDLAQVILNLVVNARDAMPDGGSIRVEIAAVTVTAADIPPSFTATPGDYVRVVVRDDGTGMTPDVLNHLFEPFFTTKEVDKGTGLGLAFTYGVVQSAHGFIAITSRPDEGTTVAIHLPLVEIQVASAIPTAPSLAEPALPPPTQATILVVEDEEPVRRVAVRTLTNAGYTVLEAASPAEAQVIFARERIDLMLTDVVMSGMRGPELARTLQAQRPGLRVVLMSGYHAPEPGEPQDYPRLDKPFTRAGLLDVIRTTLSD